MSVLLPVRLIPIHVSLPVTDVIVFKSFFSANKSFDDESDDSPVTDGVDDD